MDCVKIGKLIRALRKDQGLTQRQLAAAMNISEQAVSKWERGLGFPDEMCIRDRRRSRRQMEVCSGCLLTTPPICGRW